MVEVEQPTENTYTIVILLPLVFLVCMNFYSYMQFYLHIFTTDSFKLFGTILLEKM